MRVILSTYGTEIRTRIPLHKTRLILADGAPKKDIAAEDADEISWKKKRKRGKHNEKRIGNCKMRISLLSVRAQ